MYRFVAFTFAVLTSLALTCISSKSAVLAGALDQKIQQRPHLVLKPGESGRLTITVNTATNNPYQLARIELEASNQVAGPVATNANCGGTETGYGGAGQRLWSWTSVQNYDWYGSSVVLNGNTGTPHTYYLGWNFDSSYYINGGSGSFHAWATSIGYFDYYFGGTSDRKYGEIDFDVYGSDACDVSGSSGDW